MICTVYRDPGGLPQARACGRTSVATVTSGAIARHGRDDSGRQIDSTDTIVAAVGEEQMSSTIQRHTDRALQGSVERWAAVPAVPLEPTPANDGKYIGRAVNAIDSIATRVGEIDVSQSVGSESPPWRHDYGRRPDVVRTIPD